MAVLLYSEYGKDPEEWRRQIGARVGGFELRFWPEVGDATEIDAVWTDTLMPVESPLGSFPNLRWVYYLGHGVGDILRDPSLRQDVIVTRQKRAAMADSLAIYVVQAVTAHHLRSIEYRDQQRDGVWHRLPTSPASRIEIAVLGLGIIGRTIAERSRDLGYTVTGWSRTAKTVAGVNTFAGLAALMDRLPTFDIVVGALPETNETVRLINGDTLSLMKQGVYIVNIGRGSLIDETALLDALGTGRVSGAALDVFATEPLPAGHPFWSHPKVALTPHGGGPSMDDLDTVYDEIAENYRRFKAGETLTNVAHRNLGY